jgi:hypothetical protein
MEQGIEMTMDGELLIEFIKKSYDSDIKKHCVQEIILENGTKNVEKWKRFVILPAKIGQKVRKKS